MSSPTEMSSPAEVNNPTEVNTVIQDPVGREQKKGS
jgi:hypothetical protein